MTELPSSVTEQYYKQIICNEDTNRLFLIDPSNKSFECNIYGNPKTKFDYNITGKALYKDRINKHLIKALNLNYDKRMYCPQSKHFDGYSQFPRPISLNNFNNKSSLLQSLVNMKRFTIRKNANILNLKPNRGLSYLSSSIAEEDTSNKENFIELINKTVREYDKEEEMNQLHKYSQNNILALQKLKRSLMSNSKDKFQGRELPKPNELDKRKYQTVVELYSNLPNEKILLKNKILRNSTSMPSLFQHEESLFEKAKKNKNKGDKSIDFLITVCKDKENNKSAIVKGERNLNFKCKEERRLLSGYQTPEVKEKGIIQKALPKLPTRGDHYKKELAIIALVNPQVIQDELRRNASDMYIFEKKRRLKLSTRK